MATKKVRVGCIQTNNEPNKRTQYNLDSVTSYIQTAAENGAELILLPELMPNEYIFSTEIWNFGETINGSTFKYLSQQSKKHHIYIGLSFLEVDALHFYNTFIMTNTNGKLIAKIRKNPAAALEAFYFKGYNNKHIFKTTDFGNIFVGICYENYLAQIENELIYYQNYNNENNKISLLLQPHSSPFAKPKPGAFNYDIICTINDTVDEIAIKYAKKFQIPVLFCNKVGVLRSKILNNTSMGGWTKIVNYDGNVVAKSENCGEPTKPVHELIIGDIDIGYSNNNNKQFEYINDEWNRWDKLLYHQFKVAEFIGYIYYSMSIKRRIKASQISGCSWFPSYGLHIVWLYTSMYILSKSR